MRRKAFTINNVALVKVLSSHLLGLRIPSLSSSLPHCHIHLFHNFTSLLCPKYLLTCCLYSHSVSSSLFKSLSCSVILHPDRFFTSSLSPLPSEAQRASPKVSRFLSQLIHLQCVDPGVLSSPFPSQSDPQSTLLIKTFSYSLPNDRSLKLLYFTTYWFSLASHEEAEMCCKGPHWDLVASALFCNILNSLRFVMGPVSV